MMNVPDEYIVWEELTRPLAEQHGLDMVQVRGLIRSCIEIIEPEIEPANIAVINPDSFEGVRVSGKTIKFNLKYALELLTAARAFTNEKGIWCFLILLKLVVELGDQAVTQLRQEDAIVAFCCYRLQRASLNRIKEYLEQIKKEKNIENVVINIEEVCKNLEKCSILELVDGEYRLCEQIIIRQIK